MQQTPKVLIVDDEDRIRELLTDTLSALGYQTFSTRDGKEALTFLKQHRIDLVIADIRMPKFDGISLLKVVKKEKPDLPVLIITGYDFNYAMDKALEGGADGFLAKPFRIGKIEELMKNVLGIKTEPLGKTKSPRKVLVAEDDSTLRKMFVETLTSLDYVPTGVENGEKALDLINTKDFDLLITDIKMPKMDGITLVKTMKKNKNKIPVIMVTGYPKDYPPQKALSEGADGYLAKPFGVDKIDELMRNLLDEREEVKS